MLWLESCPNVKLRRPLGRDLNSRFGCNQLAPAHNKNNHRSLQSILTLGPTAIGRFQLPVEFHHESRESSKRHRASAPLLFGSIPSKHTDPCQGDGPSLVVPPLPFYSGYRKNTSCTVGPSTANVERNRDAPLIFAKTTVPISFAPTRE